MRIVKVRPTIGKTTITDYRNTHSIQKSNIVFAEDKREDPKGQEKEQIKIPEKNVKLVRDANECIQQLWKEYRENTSLHGLKQLKHVRTENRYQLRWIIWIIALIGMGALLIYTVYGLLIAYGNNPTLTNINVKFVKEMSYPAITICNMSPYKTSAVNATEIMAHHLLHKSRLGVILTPLNYSDPLYNELKNPYPEDWLDDTSYSLSDLFVVCVNKRVVVSCFNILSMKITQWGTCYTYSDYDKVKAEGRVYSSMTGSTTALTFYINIKQDEYVPDVNMAAGVKIILHDPDEEPDVYNKGFILSPGFSTYVSMKMTKYKYLPAPYKAGGDQYCIDVTAPGDKKKLQYYPTYSRTGCMLECRRDYIVKHCGCRAVTDPGNETLCSPFEIATCYYKNEVEFDSSPDIIEQCRCLISCEFTTFDQSISTATFPADVYGEQLYAMGFDNFKQNYLEVRLYYDSLSYLHVESIPEYNMGDIVGILGGQMGIFLGASLLTVSELLEFVILAVALVIRRCWCCLRTKRDKFSDNDFSSYG